MGAMCGTCKNEMVNASDGCVPLCVLHKGKRYGRVRVGDKGDFCEGEGEVNDWCGRCGAKKGKYHHAGCVCERCPVCGRQLITCGCIDEP